jgi:hypothetical protein
LSTRRGLGFGRALFAFALVLGGCASPIGTDDAQETTSTTGLGVPAVVEPQAVDGNGTAPVGVTEPTGTSVVGGATENPTATTAGPATTTAQAERDYVERLRHQDARGDHGSGAPSYADASVLVVDATEEYLRVSVMLAGQPRATLGDRETAGIGVDFFSDAVAIESDYQLFADGGPNGWTAYLESPGGRVRYPGTLTIGENRLVWELPWAAIGGRRQLYVSAFSDWSNGDGAFGEDFLPDVGKVRLIP